MTHKLQTLLAASDGTQKEDGYSKSSGGKTWSLKMILSLLVLFNFRKLPPTQVLISYKNLGRISLQLSLLESRSTAGCLEYTCQWLHVEPSESANPWGTPHVME